MYDNTVSNSFIDTAFDTIDMELSSSNTDASTIFPVASIANAGLEESYFSSAIRFIKESNTEYANARIQLYQNISEASSGVDVLGALSNFFGFVKKIIEKFLKFIKSIFERFIAKLNSLIGNDKFLHKHKDEIVNFNDDNSFTIKGFKYTFENNIPNTEPIVSFGEDLFHDINPGSNKTLTSSAIKQATANFNTEAAYEKFRGDVLGKTTAISSGDYAEELFKIFRDGDTTASDLDIGSTEISESKRRFLSFKDTKKAIENNEKNIKRAYDSLLSLVKKISEFNGTLSIEDFKKNLPSEFNNIEVDGIKDNSMTTDFMSTVDLYIKSKCNLIQEFSNIHAMAFTAKLDAVMDCNKQDKAILYKALDIIYREKRKK